MTFGEAIELLRQGHFVTRSAGHWDSRYLGAPAREHRDWPRLEITYVGICTADYHPCAEDVFAQDWEILI